MLRHPPRTRLHQLEQRARRRHRLPPRQPALQLRRSAGDAATSGLELFLHTGRASAAEAVSETTAVTSGLLLLLHRASAAVHLEVLC